jgi:hypothetical protein
MARTHGHGKLPKKQLKKTPEIFFDSELKLEKVLRQNLMKKTVSFFQRMPKEKLLKFKF